MGTTAGTEAALKRRISGAAAFARREFRIVAGLLAFALLAAAFLNIAEEVVEGDTSAIDLAIAKASACSLSSGTTRLTSPMTSHLSASTRSQVNISSRARDVPTSRVSSHAMP